MAGPFFLSLPEPFSCIKPSGFSFSPPENLLFLTCPWLPFFFSFWLSAWGFLNFSRFFFPHPKIAVFGFPVAVSLSVNPFTALSGWQLFPCHHFPKWTNLTRFSAFFLLLLFLSFPPAFLSWEFAAFRFLCSSPPLFFLPFDPPFATFYSRLSRAFRARLFSA